MNTVRRGWLNFVLGFVFALGIVIVAVHLIPNPATPPVGPTHCVLWSLDARTNVTIYEKGAPDICLRALQAGFTPVQIGAEPLGGVICDMTNNSDGVRVVTRLDPNVGKATDQIPCAGAGDFWTQIQVLPVGAGG
ncbi:MAG: hypothetical protein ABI334_00500 [Candidatus Dormiibacterota bacterium]